MPIQYYLLPNPNTPDPNDQYARVSTTDSLGLDDIAAQLVREGHATSAEAATAVISAFMDITARAIADGKAVNLPLMTIRPGVTGVFTDVNDSFDPARHTLRANLQSGPMLDDALRGATTQKTEGGAPAPHLVSFVNMNTGAINAAATKGGIGQLLGSELKFDPTKTGAGIYFINQSTTVVTKVDTIAKRTDGELVFIVPAGLTPAGYFVEVRRAYGHANTLRTGRLPYVLTVA